MGGGDQAMRGGDAAAESDPTRLRKRSVMIAGHRTSVSLEDAFWVALQRIARDRGESVGNLITRIDRNRTGNLSSALRVFVLGELEGDADAARPISRGPS